MRVTRSVEVGRSVDEVYRYLVVAENHPRFVPGLREFRQTSPGAEWQVGGTAMGVRRLLGRDVAEPVTFTENDGESTLAFAGRVGPFPAAVRYVLSPSPRGTRVEVTIESHLEGLGRLAEPVLELAARRNSAELVARLRDQLEHGMHPS